MTSTRLQVESSAASPMPVACFEALQRRCDFSLRIGKPLADRDRRGAMVHAEYEERVLHLSRNSRRACPDA